MHNNKTTQHIQSFIDGKWYHDRASDTNTAVEIPNINNTNEIVAMNKMNEASNIGDTRQASVMNDMSSAPDTNDTEEIHNTKDTSGMPTTIDTKNSTTSPLPTERTAQKESDTTTNPSSTTQQQRAADVKRLHEKIVACTRCPLSETRTNAVPGVGVLDPATLVIGEAPGAHEDAQGKPFVGRAGVYLDKWLHAIGLSRDTNVFIANIIKCRPPQNRIPTSTEISSCTPYLKQQIALVRPKTILAVGLTAGKYLLGIEDSLAHMRSKIHIYENVPLFITYHPSAVLRNPTLRSKVWEDLQKLQDFLSKQ